MSVRTAPMIASPFAISLRPVATSVGRTWKPVCNQCGHATPMIAIPAADDCRSLQVAAETVEPLVERHLARHRIMMQDERLGVVEQDLC